MNHKLFLSYLPIASLIALFIYLGFYGTASSDDYADYMQVEKFGYFTTVKETYLHWGGRFTSYFLVYLINPLNIGESNGPILLILIQVCMFAFIPALLSKYITKRDFNSIEYCLCFSLLTFVMFCYIPKPVEVIYWFTGSWVYLPGLIGICYWLLLAYKFHLNKIEKAIFVFLPFLIAGTNELNVLIFAWLTIVYGLSAKPNKLYWLAIFLFSIGASIALLTPGNYQRSNFFLIDAHHNARDVVYSIKNSFRISFHYLKDWFRSTPILIIWLSISLLISQSKFRITGKHLLLISSIFLMIPVLFFLFIYGTGMTTPPDRLLNVAFIFILLSGSVIFPRLISFFFLDNKGNIKLVVFIGLVLLFQATYSSRLRTALFDLEELTAYSKECNERIKLAKKHADINPNDTLVVPAIKHIPYSIFYSDLNTNAGHWYNQGFAYYHKIKAVKIMNNE